MPTGRPPDPATLERPWVDTYPPGVPPTYQLPAVTLPRLLDDAVRDFPHDEAVVVPGGRLDQATLRDRVRDVQRGLSHLGVAAGDRVLVALPNLASLPVVLFALWRIGAVAVPVAPGARTDHLAGIASDARIGAAVGPRRVVRDVLDGGPDGLLGVVVDDDQWLFPPRWYRPRRIRATMIASAVARVRSRATRSTSAAEGSIRLEAAMERARADDTGAVADPARPATADDLAVLAYPIHANEPHGVELTHANLVAAAFAVRLWIPDVQAGRERILVADGATSLAPLVLGLLTGMLSAATVILADDPDPAVLARTIEQEQPTLLPISPRRLEALLGDGDVSKRDLSSLRVVLATGAAVDRRLATDVERRTGGARVREGFGSTEAGPLTHAQPVYGRVVSGTIGVPVTDAVAVVVDPDDLARRCAPGEVGLLLVRGPQVARGYWGRPDETDARFVDGWVVTDDLVVMDPDGVFHHIGRFDEVVERDGELVIPRRIEAVLETHAGVRRAGVVHDPGADRLLAAVVCRRRHRPTTDELVVHCRAHLDSPAVPDHVTMVEELPETEAGDLARDALRELLAGAGGDAS